MWFTNRVSSEFSKKLLDKWKILWYNIGTVKGENNMYYDFYTNTHGFRRMEFSEIKQLEVGDKIAICICNNLPTKMEFINATVVRPMFWNSDADEPDWEIETDKCFTDIYSIYEVTEF